MRKPLYKTTKVIHNAHLHQFEVYYRNWFFWHFDSCYKYDEQPSKYPIHYCNEEEARKRAIERGEGMLGTAEVWRQSQVYYY